MELSAFFRSITEQDRSAVVVCDLEHTIIYMNPAAVKRYGNRGGASLVGRNLLACHNTRSGELINEVADWFRRSKDNNIVFTGYNKKDNMDVYMVAMRDEEGTLIGYYEKHEQRSLETAKAYDMG